MPYLPIDPVILILATTTILAGLLYLREYNLRQKSVSPSEKLLEETQQKAYTLLFQAIKKAQAILGLAELEGIKVVATSKLSTGKLEKDYATTLSKEIGEAQKGISVTEAEFTKFLDELRNRTTQLETSAQEITKQRIGELFERFETRLADFLLKTESESTRSIELELKSARQLIETYKNQQLALIDENIIAMMEQTLSYVLNKKLSLKEQTDLVYEALEKAKLEKFIV